MAARYGRDDYDNSPMPKTNQTPTSWVWPSTPNAAAPNQYADFRVPLHVDQLPRHAQLRICVDTNFVAWVNGQMVGTGQFSDFPDDRTYSTIDITTALTAGDNVLAIQAHYCGVQHASYIPGDAGLWFEVETDGVVIARSDASTLGRTSPHYTTAHTSRVTIQRGFTFCFQANSQSRWLVADYATTSEWSPVVLTHSQQIPRPRPLKMLNTDERLAGVIVAQGLLKHGIGNSGSEHRDNQSIAAQMQHDFLSARRPWELFEGAEASNLPLRGPVTIHANKLNCADGAYVLYDLEREECGFIDLQLHCESGCVIDIAVGEHVDDLRVRANIGGRNFASRYIASAGIQTFTHWHHRYAGRYLQIHITKLTGALRLDHVGFAVASYPVHEIGRYEENDQLLNRIWITARKTLRLCMFEHYEDCPLREQALYANDGRNQMLSGYYLFNDYDFPRESLDLLHRTTEEDGYQHLCAPAILDITIPSFTMTWMLALRDYLLYTGDAEYCKRVFPQVKQMLACYESTLDHQLLPCPTGKRYWHFYDWAPGLDGTQASDCTQFACIDHTRFDAPLNALWVMALRAIAQVATYIDDRETATHYQAVAGDASMAIHQAFFESKSDRYRTYLNDDANPHFSELTQAMMVLANVGDASTRQAVTRRLANNDHGMVPATLSQSLYKYEAILQCDALADVVRIDMLEKWSSMLLAGATSFWETQRGGWDFHHAGSLCHGWSGTPAYFLGAYGLGIKPIEPGFRRVSIHPVFNFDHAQGIVPTPLGQIAISLQRSGDRYHAQITAPNDVEFVYDHDRITID